MKVKLLSLLAVVALIATLAFPQANVASAAKANSLALPISGSTDTGAVFDGIFTLQRFAVQNGELVAVGTISGTLTDVLGAVLGTVTNVPVAIPVTNLSGTCEILDLELGPLDLDLLGLVVHLDRIDLEITAESGSGNLLGNLLCAVANLLDSDGALSSISRLLNQVLGALG